jgi:hypothetical protein
MWLPAYSLKTKFLVGDKIFVENVRHTMGVSRFTAKLLCNMAVVDGTFDRWYGVECPTCSRIIARYRPEEVLPSEHECEICESEGRSCRFPTATMSIVEFYTMNHD